VNRYAGTAALAQLIVRRDRVRLAIWVYAIVGLIASTAYSFHSLYPTREGLAKFGASIASNPTLLAVDGPLFSTDTVGGLTAWRFGGFAAVLAAIMSVLTVVRHTRAEEESGRTELVGAGVVGRLAPLSAALLVAGAADLAIGALTAVVMVLLGTGTTGSVALGAAVAAGGLMFAAVAAVAAQLTDGSRAANGIGMAVLGAAFLLRALGDGSTGGLRNASWLSPIGWTQQVRPYADERWWVLALALAFMLVLTATGYALVQRRDVGSGLVPTRLGPASAGRGLAGSLGLAWRLHRGSLYGWSVGFLIIGAVYGGAASSVTDLLKTSSELSKIINRLGGTTVATNAYFTAVLGLAALVASAYGIQAVLRARSEETAVRAEPLLATAVNRWTYAGGHLLFGLGGTAVLLVMTGLGAGIGYGLSVHDAGQVPRLIGAGLAQWPAAAVLAGFAAAVFGLLPQWTTLAWVLLGAVALLGQLGPVLRLPQPVLDLSPFTHVPHLPGGTAAAEPLLLLTLLAAVLVTAGLAGFRRRDIG
jgi:ABC-2 type transport system permease protein